MPPEPTQTSLSGAIVGRFIVGDGTLVGQGTTESIPFNPSRLILRGKAFTAVIFTGDFQVVSFTVKPLLLLRAKTTSYTLDELVWPGKPVLTLKGQFYTTIVPVFAHTGKSVLILAGKPYATAISSIVNVGKPKLVLTGKKLTAAQIALTPTVPTDIVLTPSVPASYDLVPSVPISSDLVPTVEEVR